jgi:hypothetical protein
MTANALLREIMAVIGDQGGLRHRVVPGKAEGTLAVEYTGTASVVATYSLWQAPLAVQIRDEFNAR